MQGLKIPVILVVFLGVLGLALLGDHLVHGQRVVAPLANELGSIPGVAEARIEGRGNDTHVYITPSGGEELIAFYPKVVELVEKHLGSAARARIEVVDARTQFLEEAYQQMRFPIEEAIATGRYTQLASSVQQVAEAYALDSHTVRIDSNHVYVELTSGEARLYAVVERQDSPTVWNRS